MSELHIQYLKNLCATITIDESQPFVAKAGNVLEQGRFLETRPPLDAFQEKIPFVIVNHFPVQPVRDGRRNERLARDGTNLRFLRCHFERRFKYRLDFWMDDPAQEVLANNTAIGITEQIQLYLVSHERFLNGEATVKVELGGSGLVDDPDRSTGLFYVYQEIFFQDNLCVVEAAPTLADKEFKINQVEVSK